MRTTKQDGKPARRVLAAMIADATVCSRMASRWKPPGLFASPHENLVAGWAVEHVRRYGKPLGRGVAGELDRWREGKPSLHYIIY